VWTWSVGITNSSGHTGFPRYKDNPQTIRRCLEVFEWVLRTTYVPAVADVFDGFVLTEEQFGAALSFHYNTGGIRRATWVKRWQAQPVLPVQERLVALSICFRLGIWSSPFFN
jgi:lysozyme